MDRASELKLLSENNNINSVKTENSKKIIENITNNLSPEDLLKGLVLSEIIGEPLSKRLRRR